MSEVKTNPAAIVRGLQHCHLQGLRLREQEEALINRCCELLGVAIDTDTLERDWCREIVMHGVDPEIIYSRVKAARREAARSDSN